MSDKTKAVILMGHGSRVPGSAKSMLKVADQIKSDSGYEIVDICHMSRLGPHFDEIFEKCVKLGATEVILIPYFLHEGLHMKLDIPKMMQECAKDNPDVRLILGKHLGYDELLVDLVK
jgi:sirohydrochlorin ferrochelatase